MKMSFFIQGLMACLFCLQVEAKNGLPATPSELRFPSAKYASATGPNCHGTSLAVTGLSGGFITDWHWVLDLILKSPFCTRIQKSQIRPGDIGAVRILGGNSLGSDLAHSMTFLSANQIFQKGSYSEDSPFEKIKLSAICAKYNMEGVCPRASAERPHEFSLEVYRCQRVDYSSLAQGPELDRQLRQVEALMERLALSSQSLSEPEHQALLENLNSVAKRGVQNHLMAPQSEASRVFFQNLIWRRLMNLKTQFHEILRYPFSRAEVSKALEEVLQSVSPT